MRSVPTGEARRPKPEWADGLRQLYDSVVNEPLPASFADLIAKLDAQAPPPPPAPLTAPDGALAPTPDESGK